MPFLPQALTSAFVATNLVLSGGTALAREQPSTSEIQQIDNTRLRVTPSCFKLIGLAAQHSKILTNPRVQQALDIDCGLKTKTGNASPLTLSK